MCSCSHLHGLLVSIGAHEERSRCASDGNSSQQEGGVKRQEYLLISISSRETLERFSDELRTIHTSPTRERGDRLCVCAGLGQRPSLARRAGIIRHRGLFVRNSRVNRSSPPPDKSAAVFIPFAQETVGPAGLK